MGKDKEIKIIRKESGKKNKKKSNNNGLSAAKLLSRRTKHRYFVNGLAYLLLKHYPKSKCQKDYERAVHCTDSMVLKDGNLTAHYCHSRLCPICNRIRTAHLINSYGPRLAEVEQLYFVTLTRPNVPAHRLAQEIKDLQATFRKIASNRWYKRETKAGMIGVRKLEVTYNSERNDYHPHFHLLVSTESAARGIVEWWLHYCQDASPDAQRIEECYGDEQGSWKEIFKYTTKLVQSSGKRRNGRKARTEIEVDALNTIFEATFRMKTFQRIGSQEAWKCAEVEEDFDDDDLKGKIDVSDRGFVENEVFRYMDDKESQVAYYVSTMTGEVLTEYKYGGTRLCEMFSRAEMRLENMHQERKRPRNRTEDILFRDWYALIPDHFDNIESDIEKDAAVICEARRETLEPEKVEHYDFSGERSVEALEERAARVWELYSMQLFMKPVDAERYLNEYQAIRNEIIRVKETNVLQYGNVL